MVAAQATKTIAFCAGSFSITSRILTIHADESPDNLAEIAVRLFVDERRAISQTDKSNFHISAIPVAELNASLDHETRFAVPSE